MYWQKLIFTLSFLFLLACPAFTQSQKVTIIDRYVFNRVFEQVKESVVSIEIKGTEIVDNALRTFNSSGSGVVWPGQYIVTNKHVIEGNPANEGGTEIQRRARNITVVLSGKKRFKAAVVGRASGNIDLTVLKIDDPLGISEQLLHPIKIGDSGDIFIGEPVLAIGSPFGLGGTLTQGIVSSIRTIVLQKGLPPPPHPMIQTDADINPGNSGGALVNLDGELIGIPTMIVSRTGTSAGIGFAIPVNVVKKVVSDILTKRSSVGSVGILVSSLDKLSPTIRKQLGINNDAKGVVVTKFETQESDLEIKLRQGDIIVSIDGKKINDVTHFKWLERNLNPGDKTKLGVMRRGSSVIEEIELIVKEAKKVIPNPTN